VTDERVPLRVLLVEDTEARQGVLTQLYRAHAWVLVTTGPRAVALLRAFEFDLVSLDYNLRGELRGTDVAHALAASRNAGARVVIHSLNPRGVEALRVILPDAVVYPVSRMAKTHAHLKWLRQQIDEQGVAFDWRDRRPRREREKRDVDT
jgi:CheY-like chemotaxis protein